jgi:hypothetical protein
MAVFTKLIWPVVDKSAVCSVQDVGSAGPLVLNGTLSDSSIVPPQISFINSNLIRTVSISAGADPFRTTSRIFIIAGFQNNAPVTDTITLPSLIDTTVYGIIHFDIITSVSVDGSITGVSVGTGNTGYLPLFIVNTGTSIINYSMSVIFPPSVTTNINYSIYQTLDQVNENFITFDNQLGNLFPLAGMINQTSSQIATYQNITNFILLKINSSGTPLTDTFDFIFLQA